MNEAIEFLNGYFEQSQARKKLEDSKADEMRTALMCISVWAKCDPGSGEAREKAMADIEKAANKALKL